MARELEPRLAARHPGVISAASAFRYDADVPLLIPPVNATHAPLVARSSSGAAAGRASSSPIPNCTTTGLAITLAPLAERFGVQAVLMTSLQAMSGAGRSPGVIGLDILDNVIPHIPKEEDKVEVETKKILGVAPGGSAWTPRREGLLHLHPRGGAGGPHRDASSSRSAQGGLEEVAGALREWKGDEVARDLPRRRPAGSRCSTTRSALSPGWTATRTAAWRPRWAACARTACSRTA